jgi:peptide/nickel transport system substrate-binding protein
VRESVGAVDPPAEGHGMAQLNSAFAISEWVAGGRAVYGASENARGGRPFVDSVEVQMGRAPAAQAIDLDVGKADIVEIEPAEPRRPSAPRRLWTSSPVRVIALVFGPRPEDARVREALALAVDRSGIHRVLLQRYGEISGALLPQWISGYAFVFPAERDLAWARSLAVSAPAAARSFTLGVADPLLRRIADRIALDARDAGLYVTGPAAGAAADVRLIEVRIASDDPVRALAGVAAAVGLPEPPRADSAEALYAAERALLEGFRVVPLFHLPDVYGVGPRVRGGPGITPMGEWRFENLWLEGGRP